MKGEDLLLKDPEKFIKWITSDSVRRDAFKDEINTTPKGFLKGFIMMVLGGRFTTVGAYKDSVVFKIKQNYIKKEYIVEMHHTIVKKL